MMFRIGEIDSMYCGVDDGPNNRPQHSKGAFSRACLIIELWIV